MSSAVVIPQPKCCPPIITNPCLSVAAQCQYPFVTPPTQQQNLCLKVRLPPCGNPCQPSDCCEEVVSFDWSWLTRDLPAGSKCNPYCSEVGRTCTNHCCEEPVKPCCKRYPQGCQSYKQKCKESGDQDCDCHDCGCHDDGKKKQ